VFWQAEAADEKLLLFDVGVVGHAFDRVLESADTIAQTFAELRNLFRPEQQHPGGQDDQQMHRLEQAFKHSYPSITYLNLSIAYCPALAVEVALRFGMTLAGFVRDGRFNVYSGEWRLR
jgi:hypothetical protein